MNPAYRAWGRFVVRHRWLVILGTLVVTALAVMGLKKYVRVDNSIEAFASTKDGDVQALLEQFRDDFGRDDAFLVLIEGDVFSLNYLKKLDQLHKELAGLNMEIPSLGQRKRDRDLARGRTPVARYVPPPRPSKVEPAKDEFADFDDMDADMANTANGDTEGWGDEAGGSIVDEVISVINVRRTRGVDGTLDVGDWMDPFPTTEAEARALGTEMKADSTLVGRVLGQAGDLSALVVRTHFMAEEDSNRLNTAISEILTKYEGPDFRTHTAGLPALGAQLNELMLSDMQGLFGYGLLLLLGTMFFLFRHPLGAFSPLLVVAVSAIWAFALAAVLGMPFTMMSNILPAFFICVGVADSVHIISVYRQMRADGLSNDDAIADAIGSSGVPVFYTSLTTVMGLLSFEFASVEAIGEMGRTGGLGVALAWVNTLTLLPALLTFNKKSLMGLKAAQGSDRLDAYVKHAVGLSGAPRGRALTLAVSSVIAVVALYFASTLRVWHNPLSWVPPEKSVAQAVMMADTKLGGASQIQLLVRGTGEYGVKDVRLAKALAQLDVYIRGYVDAKTGDKVVGNTISLLDVLRETNRALHNGQHEHYRVPDTQEETSHLFVAFENSDPSDLKRLMTIDASTAQMTITLKWLEATSYGPLTEYLEAGIAKFLPDKTVAVIHPTGSAYVLLTTVSALIGDLLSSFGVAFVVITLIMIVLLRDLKLGLVAMVPNLLPIAMILGFMGMANIPIDMANLMIASIALGIAVDDTIHFLHHFKVHYDEHGSVEDGIAYSVKHCGRALVLTSIILAAGFFVYLAATMYSLQRFGLLIGLTVIFALLADIYLTPALLRLTYKDRVAKARS